MEPETRIWLDAADLHFSRDQQHVSQRRQPTVLYTTAVRDVFRLRDYWPNSVYRVRTSAGRICRQPQRCPIRQ